MNEEREECGREMGMVMCVAQEFLRHPAPHTHSLLKKNGKKKDRKKRTEKNQKKRIKNTERRETHQKADSAIAIGPCYCYRPRYEKVAIYSTTSLACCLLLDANGDGRLRRRK